MIRTIQKPRTPYLWEWMVARVHITGLVPCIRTDSYNVRYGLTYRRPGMKAILQHFAGTFVAEVYDDKVHLFAPEWSADFEAALLEYEKETSATTELIICEGA